MPFNSLSSIINQQLIQQARRQASSQVRLGSAASLNLGTAKLLSNPQTLDADTFVWGTNQGVWGSFKIINQYKPL